MTGYKIQDLMATMASEARIPEFPIPEAPKLRELLVEQILAFQSRYIFAGERHTKESLMEKTDEYLERLFSMQLYGIASSKVRDKLLGY